MQLPTKAMNSRDWCWKRRTGACVTDDLEESLLLVVLPDILTRGV